MSDSRLHSLEFDRARIALASSGAGRRLLLLTLVALVNASAIASSDMPQWLNGAFAFAFLALATLRTADLKRHLNPDLPPHRLAEFAPRLTLLCCALGCCWGLWVFLGQQMPANGQMVVSSLVAGACFVTLGTLAVYPAAYLGLVMPPILALATIPVVDSNGDASYLPIFSGSLLAFSLLMLVRHKRVAEQGLRDAIRLAAFERSQRHLFESGRAAIVNVTETSLERISQPARELLGLSELADLGGLREGLGLSSTRCRQLIQRAQRAVTRHGMLSLSGRFARADGATLWLDLQVCAADAARPELGLIVTLADVTANRAVQQRNYWLANHDNLTGLPNRVAFERRLQQLCQMAHDDPASHFSILSLDLNGFKVINDTLGHAAGDETLKIVAYRIKHALRGRHPGADRAADLVARFGGDEFAVLLEGMPSPDLAYRVAETIAESIDQPMTIGDRTTAVGVSTGVAHWPTDGTDQSDLLRQADSRMYAIKLTATVRAETTIESAAQGACLGTSDT